MSETSASSQNEQLAQLEGFFGTTDLLQILGVKNKEAYLLAPNDTFTTRQAYLRSVLRLHPDSNCISSEKPEQYREYLLRCRKLFVLRDIYEFMTSEKVEVLQERQKYFKEGMHPNLLSLEILANHDKCRKRFGIPPFEAVAGELKEIYDVQMRRLKELHGENFTV